MPMENILLNYFLKNFSLFYKFKNAKIAYGNSGNETEIIIKNDASSSQDKYVKKYIFDDYKDKRIPFLYTDKIAKEIITQKDNKIIINYDIVASAFYFLSGLDEILNKNYDKLGRFKYKNSLIEKLNLIGVPVVNYYFSIFYDALELAGKNPKRKNLWDSSDFAVFLSHDIDVCKSAWFEAGKYELFKGNLFKVIKLLGNKIIGKDDWFNFEKITEIEKNYNAKSTFFFLPEKGKKYNLKNADYDIKSQAIQTILENLKNTGFEIGVHGSFGTHNNPDKLKDNIEKISTDVIGNRFHFLMFDNNKTPATLELANIKYDSTIGFAEHIGFRRATCYPFYLFDFKYKKISPVIEIPLMVMDATLKYAKYMNLTPDEAVKNILPIIKEIKKFGGVFTILWHNTFFSQYKYEGWKDVYIEILNNLNNSLLTNGKDIYERIKK